MTRSGGRRGDGRERRNVAISMTAEDRDQLATLGGEEEYSRSSTIRRIVRRYVEVLDAELPDLEKNQRNLILDALNGVHLLDEHVSVDTSRFAWVEVAEAVRLFGLAEKWQVADPDALIARLRGLTRVQAIALTEAVAAWWRRVGHGDQDPPWPPWPPWSQ